MSRGMTAREFRRTFIKDRFREADREPRSAFSFVRYAWPGGYPLYLVMRDGGYLCADCVDTERGRIHAAALDPHHSGWEPMGLNTNYENPALYCDNCYARIESAYAEDQAARHD